MAGVRDDFAEALAMLAVRDRICETDEGLRAAEIYAEAVAEHGGDDAAAVRTLCETEEGRDTLATLGEAWIQADRELRGYPPPPMARTGGLAPAPEPSPLPDPDEEAGELMERLKAEADERVRSEAQEPANGPPPPPPWEGLQQRSGWRM